MNEVRKIMSKTGFFLSDLHGSEGISFDFVARRDEILILAKILTNVDSFTRSNANQLKTIANLLEGSPLLIGCRSGSGTLQDGVVYSRFGIPILSLNTLKDFFVEGIPPFIFSAPGGLYVRIDSSIIQRARKERRISLGTLAEKVGVSRRAIKMYEEGMGATVEVALRLEGFLGVPIVTAVDPFSYTPETERILTSWENLGSFERDVFEQLSALGYNVVPTWKCPFDALTQDKKTLLLTGIERKKRNLAQKALIVGNISKVVEKESVIFVERIRLKYSLAGTPLVHKDELKKMRGREEMIELISERKK